jgi:hypothetical protein
VLGGVANPTLQDSAGDASNQRPQDPDNDLPQGIIKAVEPERRVVVSYRLALGPAYKVICAGCVTNGVEDAKKSDDDRGIYHL